MYIKLSFKMMPTEVTIATVFVLQMVATSHTQPMSYFCFDPFFKNFFAQSLLDLIAHFAALCRIAIEKYSVVKFCAQYQYIESRIFCRAQQSVLSKLIGFGQKILEKQIKTKVAHRLGQAICLIALFCCVTRPRSLCGVITMTSLQSVVKYLLQTFDSRSVRKHMAWARYDQVRTWNLEREDTLDVIRASKYVIYWHELCRL